MRAETIAAIGTWRFRTSGIGRRVGQHGGDDDISRCTQTFAGVNVQVNSADFAARGRRMLRHERGRKDGQQESETRSKQDGFPTEHAVDRQAARIGGDHESPFYTGVVPRLTPRDLAARRDRRARPMCGLCMRRGAGRRITGGSAKAHQPAIVNARPVPRFPSRQQEANAGSMQDDVGQDRIRGSDLPRFEQHRHLGRRTHDSRQADLI